MKWILGVLAVLAGCGSNAIRHDPGLAVAEANKLLRTLYFDEDYTRAYDELDPGHKVHYEPDHLRQTVDQMRDLFGNIEELQAYSYELISTERSITLYYKGTNQRGASYHRVVLVGDADSGYKVTGVFLASQQYPGPKLHLKSPKDALIK